MAESQRMTAADLVDKLLADEHADVLRDSVAWLVTQLMEAEVGAWTGAELGERGPDRRQAQRNGYRQRRWDTGVGELELAIPKLRTGSYFPSFGAAPASQRGGSEGTRQDGSLSFRDFASAEVSEGGARQPANAPSPVTWLTISHVEGGAGQRRARLADQGSSLCWQPSAVGRLLGRCFEEPQHQRGDELRIIGDRDVAQAGEPAQLRMLDEGEEPRALHADQRVGGSLQEKDRAGDALQPRRDIEHGRLHGFQVARRLGEVQQQLTRIVGGQLPGSAPLHGKEQRPSGSCGSHLSSDGREQRGQGSSSQQCRRLVDALQGCAQPVGGDRDDRMGAAPRGQLKGDPGPEGIPSDVELGHAKPVQLPFDGIGQGRRRRRDLRGEGG
jgi:hypothetical protein